MCDVVPGNKGEYSRTEQPARVMAGKRAHPAATNKQPKRERVFRAQIVGIMAFLDGARVASEPYSGPRSLFDRNSNSKVQLWRVAELDGAEIAATLRRKSAVS